MIKMKLIKKRKNRILEHKVRFQLTSAAQNFQHSAVKNKEIKKEA
jgi:hypothetical protein